MMFCFSSAEVLPKLPVSNTSSKTVSTDFLGTDCDYCIYFGSGINYLVFQQKPPQNIEPVDFRNFGGPSFLFEATIKINKDFRYKMEYQNHPTSKMNSNSLVLNNNHVKWFYTNIGGEYLMPEEFVFFKYQWKPRIIFSYQIHSMPFMVQNESGYTINNEGVDTLSAGFHFDIFATKYLTFIWRNRLQVPVRSHGELRVHSGVSLDGVIGIVRVFSKKWSSTLYWGGQYHQFDYSFNNSSGKYILGNSQLSVGLGYSY